MIGETMMMSTNILDKENSMRRNILLTRIAEALEKQNEYLEKQTEQKQKELEFLQYQSEIMLKEYELELKRNSIEKDDELWQGT